MTGDDASATEDDSAATWDEVKRRENRKRQATKTFVLEYPDGFEAVFEYRMVEDIGAIAREHTTRTPTRSGQDPEVRMTEDQEWAFAADLFQEAIVSAPEGFSPTERELREGLTKPVVDEMVEAIRDFATLDEETRIKFR
ncbi:hypothetical protein [Salinilacihabitans rarus]|uniref:hypothetical protein n=1 Tax=Salinilacihabitans rarus TaxID=2961596 RepID=UPI0020C84CFA|nr:hypothetical protein [Salinilacihabitans rarus]